MVLINGQEFNSDKPESLETERLQKAVKLDKEYAQRCADIWMRSAPNAKALQRRKWIVEALGLSNVITFQ